VEDVVAVRVTLKRGGRRYFLTWGRLFDPVDGSELEAVVGQHLDKFALSGTAAKVELCVSLQEASKQPYFFEALWALGQERIPFGPGYKKWAAMKRGQVRQGRGLHYLGARTGATTGR